MASDVVVDGLTSGWTNLVAVFRKESDSTYWNGATWEAYNASNIATYAVAATEIGSTGAYYAVDPDTTRLKYVVFTRKAGSDLAVTDMPNAVASGTAGPILGNVGYVDGEAVYHSDGRLEVVLRDGAITDAKFTIPSLTAPATGVVGMLVQLWRRNFKKSTLTSSQLKTYADDGSTVVTTQTVSDDGTTQTQGAAT